MEVHKNTPQYPSYPFIKTQPENLESGQAVEIRGESVQVSERTLRLFAIFCLLIALPISLPWVGVSIASVVFVLMIADTLLNVPYRHPKTHALLVGWSYTFFIAVMLSLFVNSLTRRITIRNTDFISLVHVIYWLAIFNITASIVSHMNQVWMQRITFVLAVSVFILACVRFAESGLEGAWGLEITTDHLTKNEYGVYFSTFSLFCFALPLMLTGWKRWASLVASVMLVIVILGNSSRASWLAIAIGFSFLAVTFLFSQRSVKAGKTLGYSLIVVAVIVTLVGCFPATFRNAITRTLNSFDNLGNDASYVTRQVLVDKGISLFSENSIFGIGFGRFTETQVTFDTIPILLRKAIRDASTELNRKSAHNAYMGLLAETGLVGAIPLAALLAALVLKGLDSVVFWVKRQELWAIAAYASFISMSVHLWTLSGLWSTLPWFIYGLLAGLILHPERLERKFG